MPFPRLLVSVLLLSALPLPTSSVDAQPVFDVLLLDYHAPIEHDVLLSHLCVEPCTRSRGCPDDRVKSGADFWSDRLTVYRPRYLGRTARFVVNAFKDQELDLLSISGHHASGFSGELGRGAFDTEKLAHQLRDLPGREDFFTGPSVVMLQGCWTDVKSGFDGDPIEYVRHIIEDTAVRAGESERLLAAVQQIAGNEQAYRELFPNACILGYQGTQVPGGLLEIYGQVNAFLRGLENPDPETRRPAKFDLQEARKSRESLKEAVRQVDRECAPGGWPCNLCKKDPDYYVPLRDALLDYLGAESRRLAAGETRATPAAQALEYRLEASSFYANTRWSCSDVAPGTPPVFPEPLDRAPYLEMFLDLLMVDFGQISGDVRLRIESELIHLLGSVETSPEVRARLLDRLESEAGKSWRRHVIDDTLPLLSTFRQRDFFDFLAEAGCASCFEGIFHPDTARVLRENAAGRLKPRLGPELYTLALEDPSARVRRLAASRLAPEQEALLQKALEDPSSEVREAAERVLEAPDS